MKSGNLNFLEPSGPLQACNGTALPYIDSVSFIILFSMQKYGLCETHRTDCAASHHLCAVKWHPSLGYNVSHIEQVTGSEFFSLLNKAFSFEILFQRTYVSWGKLSPKFQQKYTSLISLNTRRIFTKVGKHLITGSVLNRNKTLNPIFFMIHCVYWVGMQEAQKTLWSYKNPHAMCEVPFVAP